MSRGLPWVLAGLATAALGLGGLGSLSRAEPATRDDWRPACVSALPGLERPEARIVPGPDPTGVLLLGLDVSRSNANAVQAQLAGAQQLLARAPMSLDVGVLLVAEHSDASAVPDLWLPGSGAPIVEVDPVCEGACSSRSLFEQRCQDQVETALDGRRLALSQEVEAVRVTTRNERRQRLAAWVQHLGEAQSAGGTSLVRFWRKVADLPAVREGHRPVTVLLLSDLVETERAHRRFINRIDTDEACPSTTPLPDLQGLRIGLLQTVGRDDPQVVGARWEQALGCVGATVERYRWTPALTLADYLPGLELGPDHRASNGNR